MMPRGSLRRFPVVGSTLAFLTGLLLAGLLNLPGFSQAQQQDSHYTAGTATGSATDTNLAAALEAMKVTSTHMAVVTDAGRQLGVVTLEDVLEQLLGELPGG